MGLYDDLLSRLDANDEPGRARTAEEEIAALRREVAALQRTVARLAAIVAQGDGLAPEVIRTRLLDEARVVAPLPAPPAEEPAAPTFGDSPYRGAVPDRPGELRCQRCRKRIEADDPELSLESARVCFACFQRSNG